MRPKTIVSVIDSSSTASDVALVRALSLADWYGATLHVVHAGHASREADGEELTRRALIERIDRVAGTSPPAGVDVVPTVLPSGRIRPIADYVNRVSADLVVIGKGERRSSGYWSAGSFAAALGKAVTVPTLTIPVHRTEGEVPGPLFQRVLAAVDFSEASLRALSDALVLAQQSDGHLTVLHVLEGLPYETVHSASRAFRLMHDFRTSVIRANRELQSLIPTDASNWAEIEVATVSGQAHEAILSAAIERRADVLVLGLPRRPRLEEYLAGSTAQRVLRRATSPVLLVPGKPATSRARDADRREAGADGVGQPWRQAPIKAQSAGGASW